MSRVATPNIDYTDRDYESYREMLIQKLQEKMPEYTDTSQSDAGIVILECLANGLDILSLYIDAIANDVLLPTTQDRRIACILARNFGYTPYNQTASVTPQVFVLNSIKEEPMIIPKGTVVTTDSLDTLNMVSFETVEDLLIPAGCLGDEKDDSGNYIYTVNVEQGSSITNDLIGTSNGSPYQTMRLNYTEVLTDSIRLFVDEGDGEEEWRQVSNFLDNDILPTSKVYTVTVDEFDRCFIEFGNGIFGKIPSVFENGITASYRVGGGSSGNVKENTITELETSLAFVDHTFNPSGSVVLAHDKETIEEIRYNAPASFRVRDRCVTLQDHSDILKINNKGLLYAIFNSVAIQDEIEATTIHLYYQMRSGYTMTDSILTELGELYNTRLMVGTKIDFIECEDYVVNIEASLVVDKDYRTEEVKTDVETYIKDVFFSDEEFTFNDEFAKSDLEGEIKSTIDGVKSFRINSPTEDIITADKPYKIIKLGTVTLNITGGK